MSEQVEDKYRLAITVAFCAVVTATPCRADLPLMVEDLLAKENRTRLNFGVSYSSRTHNSGFTFKNQDRFTSRLGLRYGVTPNTEVYGRVSGIWSEDRALEIGTALPAARTQRWRNLVAGVTHQFSRENATPAFLGFLETSLIENAPATNKRFIHGKTWTAGFTTYRSIDPVVLTLTAGYSYTAPRTVMRQEYKDTDNDPDTDPELVTLRKTLDPGDYLYLEPNLNFAINDRVSISGGVRLSHLGKSTGSGASADIHTTRTDLLLGMSFAPTSTLTLHTNASADISGDGGSSVGIHMAYPLGR